MTVSLSISVSGIAEVHTALNGINPRTNSAWVARALTACAKRTQEIAAKEKIKRGGKGPPLPNMLTSRTGTLRRSIAVDRRFLPWAIEVGTDLKYGAVHETGGSFGVKSVMVREHKRRSAFGRKVAAFTVPAHFRSGHYADYPPRPFLGPGLEKAAEDFDQLFARELEKELK